MDEKPQVFISYAHADSKVARKIHGQLTAAGLRPWIDEDDILTGQDWLNAIKTAIRRSDFFLLCLSPRSIDRRGVLQREVRTALDVRREKLHPDIYFLPAWIQAGEPFPKDEMEELPDELKNIQWVNLGEPSGWDKLLRSINHQLGRLGKRGANAVIAMSSTSGGSMAEMAQPILTDLKVAIKARDRSAAQQSCERLENLLDSVDGGLPTRVLRPLLMQLSRKRWFDLLGPVADAAIRSGTAPPYVRRCYAEALRQKGFHSAGVEMLEAIRAEVLSDPTELREVSLNLCYAYAEWYALGDAAQAKHVRTWIEKAIALGEEVHRVDPRRNLLHGILAASLAARAKADGVQVQVAQAPADTAQEILDEVEQRQEIGFSLLGGLRCRTDCMPGRRRSGKGKGMVGAVYRPPRDGLLGAGSCL
jgi:TIR domain